MSNLGPIYSLKSKFITSVFLGSLLSLTPILSSASLCLQSGSQQNALLELYSSEGCSSCPPAESWVSQFKHSEKLWDAIIPVSFHVTYWDYLGWPDPLADETYTQRQVKHKQVRNARSVYTPAFILNGRETTQWFKNRTIHIPNGAERSRTGVLSLHQDNNNQYRVEFLPTVKTSRPLTAHLAILGMDITRKIEAGENHGRTLNHDFVALEHSKTISYAKNNQYQWQFTPELSDQKRNTSQNYSIAVWVENEQLRPLQAIGGALNNDLSCVLETKISGTNG